MKFSTPAKIAVAVVAVVLTGTVTLAASRHQNPLRLVGLLPAPSTSPLPSASPAATVAPTPSPSPAPTAKATPGPTPYLDFKNGPCQGINASDDECVTKNPAKLEIASVIMPVASVTCSASSVDVSFGAMVLTRHYLAGGSGDATVQIDFSDGTSSPVYTATFAANTNQQLLPAISHQFPSVSPAAYSYRVRLITPNQLPGGFYPIYTASSPTCAN